MTKLGRAEKLCRALVQWIDADFCPTGAEQARNEPDRVDWARCIPCIVLHLGCLGVLWVGWSWAAVAFAAVGWGLDILWLQLGTDAWQLLVWGFFISATVLCHGTSCINSLAHLLGSRRFATEDDSRNSWRLALITLGEGWHHHHHHHRYQSSTRNGFYWWEFDPTYHGLRLLERTGLIWGLKPVPAPVLAEGGAVDQARTGPNP